MDDQTYLEPDFDPSTLTIPRLRSILVAHNVNYPSSAKKQQLIDLFNDKVVSQARNIRAANARVKRTSRGIEDIGTGRKGTGAGDPVDDIPPTPTTTRSSRRTTRARTEEAQDVEPTPRGMRHSTAPPEGVTPRVVVSGKHATIMEEESTPKRQRQERSERSVSRTARTRQSAATPVAVKVEEDESSPFSNENVFQSHATPSDQLRPVSRDSERRRTTMSSARSTSAARDLERRNRDLRRRTEEVRPFRPQTDGAVLPSHKTFEVPIVKQDHVDISEEFTPEEAQELVTAQASGELVPVRRHTQGPGKFAKRGVGAVLLVMASAVAGLWRQEKFQVGYCGVGQPSTEVAGVEVPPWADVVRPQCEPCPPHAFCHENLQTECENGFVLTQHPLSFNGLVPLPPTCEPDSAKARKVNAVKERAVEALRLQNAKYECGEASAPALKEAALKSAIATKRRKGMSNEEFEDLWSSAIGEIVNSDEIVSGIDGAEPTLRSTSLARLPFSCAVRRSLRETLREYLWQVIAVLLIVFGGSYTRYRITTGNETEVKAKHLASHALEKLSYQAALHAQDPDLYQENYISVAQLRDDVLRNEFSATRRRALWEKVAKKVEGNSNVRPMVREGRSGDVGRVWEWVGAVGYLESPEGGHHRRKSGRVSFAPGTTGGESSSFMEGSHGRPVKREEGKMSKWEEQKQYY
ncbi:hypothetical protein AC579_3906 [Pseudocercospora musae]|uniref:LEM-like domain-containing protein n=1 Tax=Pseudocercospora musae TaxID=113226 RepID=A0A139I197_9PEZI|nr:hypothetical protein AC579_3906 [Pseudocercospora musae]